MNLDVEKTEDSQGNRDLPPLVKNPSTLKMSQGDYPEELDVADGKSKLVPDAEPKSTLERNSLPNTSVTAPKIYNLRSGSHQASRMDNKSGNMAQDRVDGQIKPTSERLTKTPGVGPGSRRQVPIPTGKNVLKDDTDHESGAFPLGFVILALFVAMFAAYFHFRKIDPPSTPILFSSYEEELKKMQSKYTNQTDRFWTTFLSSLEPILTTDDPDLPAVIMMAVPDDHHSMGLCFMQHVAEVLNKLLEGPNPQLSQPSYVDGSKLSSFGADEQKLKMDEEIRKIIKSKQRTIIVNGLEKLDPQAILLFHGYCDNSEAVFKNIAILFMVRVPEESNYSTDEEVYAFLFRLWTVLGNAKTKALLARMANNVAIMQKSSHFIC